MSPHRYFTVVFEWHSRPRFRPGRVKTCELVFAANDQTHAYRLAQDYGEQSFPRHKWKVLSCKENPAAQPPSTSREE